MEKKELIERLRAQLPAVYTAQHVIDMVESLNDSNGNNTELINDKLTKVYDLLIDAQNEAEDLQVDEDSLEINIFKGRATIENVDIDTDSLIATLGEARDAIAYLKANINPKQ